LIVSLPVYDPNKIKAPYAYVMKISNYGKFAHKPKMNVSYPGGSFKPVVSFATDDNEEIHYTIDGTDPNSNSSLYTKPFSLNKTSLVKAISILPNALPGSISSGEVKIYQWMNAEKIKNPVTGISWKYYEPSGKIDLQSIQSSPVMKEGIANSISEKVKQRQEKYALQFDGYIKINNKDVYTFSTLSDDGSKLFIDDEEIVNNDGEHGGTEEFGNAALKNGYHKIKVIYFDSGGGNELKVYWSAKGKNKEIIPANVLFH